MTDENSKEDVETDKAIDLISDQPEAKLDETRLRYENGKCFYSEPGSGTELEWDEDKQVWVPVNGPDSTTDYTYENGVCCYVDKTTNLKYQWNADDKKWEACDKGAKNEVEEEDESEDEDGEKKIKKNIVRQDMSKGVYGFDGDTHTYVDESDGTKYIWDKEKNAWFPKIDDDFMARYQMSYGTNSESEAKPEVPVVETKPEITEPAPAQKQQEPTWFDMDDRNNTKVYVSNLPTDITEPEFVDLMQKCGLVMKDIDTGKMKIKLYTEKGFDGAEVLKGDALCTYIKVESVELALNLLDGLDVKGKKIHVERAKFTMKGGAYDPSLKPKKRKRKDRDKLKKIQEKLFDWRPEKLRNMRPKHERIIIVKNLFDPSIFDQDVGLIIEYQQDLREECMKCGVVRKITLFDPEGVAQINFKEAEAADACIQLLNDRWFGKRQITADTWDGKTKFKIAETEAEINDRLNKWDSFLEDKDPSKAQTEKGAGSHQETKTPGSGNDTASSADSGEVTE